MNPVLKKAINLFNTITIIGLVQILVWYIIYGDMTWYGVKNTLFYNYYYGIPLFLLNSLPSYVNPTWNEGELNKGKILMNFIMGLILSLIGIFVLNIILLLVQGEAIVKVLSKEFRTSYLTGMIISLLVSLIYHSVFFYKAMQEMSLLSEKLEKEKIRSEHQSLRAHIDPHFLFNSFNVLSGLIDENTDKAQQFLSKLAKVYRHLLEQRDDEKVPIRQEMDFARNYIQLLSMRFQDAIVLDVKLSDDIYDKRIAPLSLQLLIENAVKHNALNKRNVLNISVYTEGDYLVVRNNILPKKILAESTGFGLDNIKERYSFLCADSVVITNDTTHFTVKLPIL